MVPKSETEKVGAKEEHSAYFANFYCFSYAVSYVLIWCIACQFLLLQSVDTIELLTI